MKPSRSVSVVWLLAFLCHAGGCKSAYYGAWEKVGVHKRDILVDRVGDARDDQEEAKERFVSALDKFSAVVQFDGGALETKYRQLDAELKRCSSKADDVRKRIAAVQTVAQDLFREWERELAEYQSEQLRRASEDQLRATRDRYERMYAAMRRAEQKMEPVLSAFRDQVLFLKHNLNARAIASLQGVAVELEGDVARLIQEMEASIGEANAFIETMEQTG